MAANLPVVIPALQSDPIRLHIGTEDLLGPIDDAQEPTDPDDPPAPVTPLPTSSVIAVGVNDGRLPKSKLEALNLYLAQHAGTYQGHPLFRISWAAEDNYGLLKAHESTCPKRDPSDFDCGCPVSTEARVPLCFHPAQQSYHLLSWSPPCGEESIAADLLKDLTGVQREQMKQEAREGSWMCVMHFCEPHPPYTPFDPTSGILETIVPIINQETERARAAMYGVKAVLQRERQKYIDRVKDERAKQEAAYDARAEDILKDAEPAFGGVPFTGAGEKRIIEADQTATDAARLGAERPAPEVDGPVFTLGRIKREKL